MFHCELSFLRARWPRPIAARWLSSYKYPIIPLQPQDSEVTLTVTPVEPNSFNNPPYIDMVTAVRYGKVALLIARASANRFGVCVTCADGR